MIVGVCALNLAGVPDLDWIDEVDVDLNAITHVYLQLMIYDLNPDHPSYFPYATITRRNGPPLHVPHERCVWFDAAEHHLNQLAAILASDTTPVTHQRPRFATEFTYRRDRDLQRNAHLVAVDQLELRAHR